MTGTGPPVYRGRMTNCPVFVMWPFIVIGAFHGNVGIPAAHVESLVALRILGVVQERCPAAQIVHPDDRTPVAAIPGYVAALGGPPVSTLEVQAAMYAAGHGAQYLLVPTVERWDQMGTDDPIGAFIGSRNRVAVSLRLMRLDRPAVMGRITFENRSHIILNQDASRLLNGRFDRALRKLLWN